MTSGKPGQVSLLVYAACPSRLAHKSNAILKFVANHGHAPLHPFQAFPYDLFEGGKPGRERTLEWCCRLIDICDELWLFGISDGTLFEVNYFIARGRKSHFRDFSDVFDSNAVTRRAELVDILDRYDGGPASRER